MEEKALEVGKVGIENLSEISSHNPYLGLLFTVFILLIIVSGVISWRMYSHFSKKMDKLTDTHDNKITELTKKIDEKNDKLYEDAKADLQMVLAFEQKLDAYLNKDNLVVNDIREIKNLVKDVKSFLEFVHK